MTLIAFPAERVERPSGKLLCDCGSSWFELNRIGADGRSMGGVIELDDRGNVISYAGGLVCHDCGQQK